MNVDEKTEAVFTICAVICAFLGLFFLLWIL
jgi:hypothetical protein